VIGLALAIGTVVLVYGISLRFEGSSTDAVLYVTQGGNLWIVPPTGFVAANRSQFIQTPSRLDPQTVAAIEATHGVQRSSPAISGELDTGGRVLAIYGVGDGPHGSVVLGTLAATTLSATAGHSIALRGSEFVVDRIDPKLPPTVVRMSYDDAVALTGEAGPSWIVATIDDPRLFLERAPFLTVTSDPSVQAGDPGTGGIAYALEGKLSRFDVYSFKAKFGATILSKATSTIFGQIAIITLLLGFLLAISSALMTIEERKVEFGILAAVGITDDVLYLFLAESAIIFVTGFVAGAALGTVGFAVFLPSLFDADAVGKAVLIVSTYIPAMLILGALIPLNRLLQRTPLELLRAAA
jgi:putative ABC transport system permease protein